MALANTFYVMSIIALSLQTLLLLLSVILLIFIFRIVTKLYKEIQTEIKRARDMISNPGRIVDSVGSAVAQKAIEGASSLVSSFLNKRSKEKQK